MNFKKDILLIDTELTGLDANKHEIIQLAAVLLDKKTLKEKKVFSSFIRPSNWKARNLESMAVNKISHSLLKDAPKVGEVIKLFEETFGHDVILAFYVGFNDKTFLLKAYKKAKVKWQFDYHIFDLWGLFYAHLAKKKMLTSKKNFAGFGLESLIKHFKIVVKETELHDALVDCRVEAEILRKIIKMA